MSRAESPAWHGVGREAAENENMKGKGTGREATQFRRRTASGHYDWYSEGKGKGREWNNAKSTYDNDYWRCSNGNWPNYGTNDMNANSDDGKGDYYGNRGISNNKWKEEGYRQVRQEYVAASSGQTPVVGNQDDRGLFLIRSDPDLINNPGCHRELDSDGGRIHFLLTRKNQVSGAIRRRSSNEKRIGGIM